MQYYMPTKVMEDRHIIEQQRDVLKQYGQKALIVTGKSSAKKSGALEDVLKALEANEQAYVLYDGMVENPPLDKVEEGAEVGRECDFIIAIGGGSPIDGAKAVGVLLKNPDLEPYDAIFKVTGLTSLPIIAVPTTAGTGTETTPYAIITDHIRESKINFTSKIFPEIAFVDVRYFMTQPKQVRNNTCVDALTHMIESYMNINANFYSDWVNEKALSVWGSVKESLLNEDLTEEEMTAFIHASSMGGMGIAQTGTSLPHGMGYAMTYEKGLAHGKANAVLTAAYLRACHNQAKVQRLLDLLGFENLAQLDQFLKGLVGTFDLTDEEVERYARGMMANAAKLKNHPDPVTLETIITIYKTAIKGVTS